MSIQQVKFKAIADKIREKTNKNTPIKPNDFASSIDEVFENGKDFQNEAFWNSYQDNGNRTNYNSAFYGNGWNNDTFNPKYDIIVSGNADNNNNMFAYSGEINLKKILEDNGLQLDTSGVTNFGTMFSYSKISALPTIDTRNAKSFNDTFLGLEASSIDKIILKNDASQTFSALTFQMVDLIHLKFEGSIGMDIDFMSCVSLDKDSIKSILNALSPESDKGGTLVLSKLAIDNAFRGFGYYLNEETFMFEATDEIVNGSDSLEWMETTMSLYNTHSNWSILLS